MNTQIYDWLIAEAIKTGAQTHPRRVLLGLNWSVVEVRGAGLCFSPTDAPRTLSWPGTLTDKPASELVEWIRRENACEAAVGTATINALINDNSPLLLQAKSLDGTAPGHLRVFEHFREQVRGAKVAVIGRYPGLEKLFFDSEYQCIERKPQPGDLPESAAETILPRADWVFITASSIANKTLPLLLELSKNAQVVLMGPSLPWLGGWRDFGVNYLAGVSVRNREKLFQIAAEGGGTLIFDEAVEYRLLAL